MPADYSNVMLGSTGVYDGSSVRTLYRTYFATTSSVANTTSSYIAYYEPGDGGTYSRATITVDDTNITLTWTKGGTPTGTIHLLIEAWT